MWTSEHTAQLESYLAGVEHIPVGIGTEEAACSVAAIRLAWDGELSDEPPACMSPVLAQWIIGVQDAMPASIRDSAEWRGLLPLAAGTGREREDERLAVIMDWLWGTVMPHLQPIADEHGFGAEWRECETRTMDAAQAAADAAEAASVSRAVEAATRVAKAAAYAYAYEYAAAEAAKAEAAYMAANAAEAAAYAADAPAWDAFDPVATLLRIIDA